MWKSLPARAKVIQNEIASRPSVGFRRNPLGGHWALDDDPQKVGSRETDYNAFPALRINSCNGRTKIIVLVDPLEIMEGHWERCSHFSHTFRFPDSLGLL